MRHLKAALILSAMMMFANDFAFADELYGNGISRKELMVILSSYGMSVTDTTERESDPWLKARTQSCLGCLVSV